MLSAGLYPFSTIVVLFECPLLANKICVVNIPRPSTVASVVEDLIAI